MLTGLSIGNFKAFGETQHIPIRPLTLIFGANSSGKSSIIHALLLANHASGTAQLDAFQTRLGGDAVDLGGFKQYVHRGNTDSWAELSLRVRRGDNDLATSALLRELSGTLRLRVRWGVVMPFEEDERIEPVRSEPLTRVVDLFLEERPFLSLYRRFKDGRFCIKSHGSEDFERVVRSVLDSRSWRGELVSAGLEATASVLCESASYCTFEGRGWLPGATFLFPSEAVARGSDLPLPEDLPDRFADATRLGSRQGFWVFAPQFLTQVMGELFGAFAAELQRLSYLGPLRTYPERHFLANPARDTNWMAGGGKAWERLKHEPAVRGRVNAWLSGARRLNTPFELSLRRLVSTDELRPILQDELETAEAGFDLPQVADGAYTFVNQSPSVTIDRPPGLEEKLERGDITVEEFRIEAGRHFEEARGAQEDRVWRTHIRSYDSLKASQMAVERLHRELHTLDDLVLVDKVTNTLVSHRDVGVGISQVLPLLVHAYGDEGQLVAVEQPEIHLHPALQAELGDVFIESALGERKNTFLLETHSEHLILRILRRVRETTEGKLPEGATPVRPEDVSVVYVQPGPKGAEVIELPVTPDGDFSRPWPNGFFAERFQELP